MKNIIKPQGAFRVSLNETSRFDKEGFSGNIYIPTDLNLGFSALKVEVNGRHYRTRIIGITRIYLVIDGNGIFTLDDQNLKIKPGDLYVIKDGHEYEYKGKMTLFEFNIPGATSLNSENLDL